MALRLYVGNIPFKVREEDLLSLFQQAGKVHTVSIIRDKFSGQSRGFGFVEMASEEEAQRAIEILNGHSLEQRQIIVNEARPQTPRSARGEGTRARYDRRARDSGSGGSESTGGSRGT